MADKRQTLRNSKCKLSIISRQNFSGRKEIWYWICKATVGTTTTTTTVAAAAGVGFVATTAPLTSEQYHHHQHHNPCSHLLACVSLCMATYTCICLYVWMAKYVLNMAPIQLPGIKQWWFALSHRAAPRNCSLFGSFTMRWLQRHAQGRMILLFLRHYNTLRHPNFSSWSLGLCSGGRFMYMRRLIRCKRLQTQLFLL